MGGRDLVAELARKRRRNGSFAGLVNQTAFAILALRAAGRPQEDPAIRAAARWLASQRNRDGGFNFAAVAAAAASTTPPRRCRRSPPPDSAAAPRFAGRARSSRRARIRTEGCR